MKPKFILLGAIIGLIAVSLVAASSVRFNPLTPANTVLAGRDYSRLSRDVVFGRLGTDFVLPVSLKLTSPGFETVLSTSSISAAVNPSLTASQIVPPILQLNLTQWLQDRLRPSTVPLHYQLRLDYQDSALDAIVASVAGQLEKPYIPTELLLKSGRVTVVPGESGLSLDAPALKNTILERLKNWQITESVPLPLHPAGQLPDATQIQATITRAQKLVGRSLLLTYENQTITVNDTSLIYWLDFQGGLKTDKITEFSHNLAATVKRDPVNAAFKFENGKVLDFRPELVGISLDSPKLVDAIIANFPAFESGSNSSHSLALPLISVDPSIRNQDVNNLGIKELLGRGVSTFKHSNATRNLNVAQGAAIVNRILVAPGAEFSFIKNLGDVTLETGFFKAYIIRAGKTELDVGGGVCQVSTTLFRAMLNAGLDITSRQYHAYRVSYYEEDSRPGFDATVFIPSPDLKFKNDTGHYVLVQNTYDGVNKKLTYEIYGTSDGRTVDISNYRQWDAAPAPPDKWIDDPTLPPGKVIQDEHAIPGLKTSFDWKVTRVGTVIHQKTFQSNYVPWAAVFRKGVSL